MLSILAKMFGVPLEAAEDVMRSERGYRAALSRRSLFAAAGALAVGRVMGPGAELVPRVKWETFSDIKIYYKGVLIPEIGSVVMASRWSVAPGDVVEIFTDLHPSP